MQSTAQRPDRQGKAAEAAAAHATLLAAATARRPALAAETQPFRWERAASHRDRAQEAIKAARDATTADGRYLLAAAVQSDARPVLDPMDLRDHLYDLEAIARSLPDETRVRAQHVTEELAEAIAAPRRKALWHAYRARGQRARFTNAASCGGTLATIGCGACHSTAAEKTRPVGCGIVRLCPTCALVQAARRRSRFGRARARAVARAHKAGAYVPRRPGGRYSEKMLTLTIPHFGLACENHGTTPAPGCLGCVFAPGLDPAGNATPPASRDRPDLAVEGRIRAIFEAWPIFLRLWNKYEIGARRWSAHAIAMAKRRVLAWRAALARELSLPRSVRIPGRAARIRKKIARARARARNAGARARAAAIARNKAAPTAHVRVFEWTLGGDHAGHPHFHVHYLGPFIPPWVSSWWAEALRSVGLTIPEYPPGHPHEGQPVVSVNVSHVEASDPRYAHEILKGGRQSAIKFSRVKVQGKLNAVDYAGGWTPAGSVPPALDVRIEARLYEALEGRRLIQGSRGLFKDDERPACPCCGAIGLWYRHVEPRDATTPLDPRPSTPPPGGPDP